MYNPGPFEKALISPRVHILLFIWCMQQIFPLGVHSVGVVLLELFPPQHLYTAVTCGLVYVPQHET